MLPLLSVERLTATFGKSCASTHWCDQNVYFDNVLMLFTCSTVTLRAKSSYTELKVYASFSNDLCKVGIKEAGWSNQAVKLFEKLLQKGKNKKVVVYSSNIIGKMKILSSVFFKLIRESNPCHHVKIYKPFSFNAYNQNFFRQNKSLLCMINVNVAGQL